MDTETLKKLNMLADRNYIDLQAATNLEIQEGVESFIKSIDNKET